MNDTIRCCGSIPGEIDSSDITMAIGMFIFLIIVIALDMRSTAKWVDEQRHKDLI